MTSRLTITEIEKRACHEFLLDGNKVQSCIRAGYAARGAHGHAHRIFARSRVVAYLQPLLENMHEKTKATAERVLEELTHMALSNIADYYRLDKTGKKPKWVLKELHELTVSQQRAISEIEPGKYIKLHSKDSALEKLAKHFKLYTDLEAGTANFNLMPVLRISGKEVIFEVGKPAPKAKPQKN